MTAHWNTITPSQYPWERAALDFVRDGLPDHEPYRAWANFEFQAADGAIYEVDLLVLTKQGFWLVEIKSRPGRVEGDAGTWTWTDREGKRASVDNPVLLANRKAKALSSLLKAKMAAQKVPMPWLDALVFLSDPEIQCDLQGAARNRVCLADREAADGRPGPQGHPGGAREPRGGRGRGDVAGRDRRPHGQGADAGAGAGRHPALAEGPPGRRLRAQALVDESPGVWQDRLAEHAALPGVFCRVRQYLVAQAADEEQRQRMKRAAAREFRILQSFDHPGILDARDYKDHEFGPALLFAYEPGAMRLDHYLATRGPKLTPGTRLELLRQVADAVRYAHSKRVIHRALAPQSVLVMDPDAEVPRLKVFNWQVGVREAEAASSATVHVQELVDRQATVYMAPEALLGPEGGVRGVRRLLARGDRLPPLQRAAPRREPGRGRADAGRAQGAEGLGGARRRGAGAGGADPLEHRPRRRPPRRHRVGLPQAARRRRGRADRPGHARASSTRPRPGGATAWRGASWSSGCWAGARPAIALLVKRGEDEFVLKVAREAEDNARLRDEAEALRKLRSEFIVGLHEVREIRGRTVLVLDKAGERDAGRAAPQGGAAGPGAAPAVRRGPAPGGRLAGAAGGRPPRHQARQHRRPLGQAAAPTDPVRLLAVARPGRADPGRHPPLPRPVPVPSAGRRAGTWRPSGTRPA